MDGISDDYHVFSTHYSSQIFSDVEDDRYTPINALSLNLF
jgi:hypothetical protein